jgi:phage gpG-like protein
MPAPVTGGVTSGAGGVTIHFRPPLEFIAKQAGSFGRRLRNLEPLWDRFEPILAQVEEEQFSTHGQGAWPPLAQSTLEQKSRHGWPSDPLVRTGSLKESLTNPGAAGDKGPMRFSYGTDVEYARYHQEGTTKMPQRQVIPDPFRVEDRRKLEQEMVKWINSEAAKAFGRIAA